MVHAQLSFYDSVHCSLLCDTNSFLYQLDIVGREESIGAVQLSDTPPPTIVNLLNVGNDLIGIK